ncbi:MAG: hypothetical protein ICV83_02125 [Cytophagales bacterium]|nr:hypothetical protein [Cytophagales bacterium]
MTARIKKYKKQSRNYHKILYTILVLIVASVLLWSFNTWVQWEWLANHPNRLVIYIASQVALFCIALLLLSSNKNIRIIEFVALVIAIASMIIPLLNNSQGKSTTNQTPYSPQTDSIVNTSRADSGKKPDGPIITSNRTVQIPHSPQSEVIVKNPGADLGKELNEPITPSKRTIFLSGMIVDAANDTPLDSVAIMINYSIIGYSDRFGIFNIRHIPDRYSETTTLQFLKQGYQEVTESTLTPVKNANINLTNKKIKLNKM